jgi:hypothetical protein
MMQTKVLSRLALCLLCSAFPAWGRQALAGCDSKGSAWGQPSVNRYCPGPEDPMTPPPRPGLPPPLAPLLLEVLPLPDDKYPQPDYYVQMYSGQGRASALKRRRQLARRFYNVLGCCDVYLRRIDIGFLGPYWSVWAGPVTSKGRAEALCQDLRLHGLDACVVEPQ